MEINEVNVTIAILALFVGIGVTSAVWSIRLSHPRQESKTTSGGESTTRNKPLLRQWFSDWLHGLSTEMVGAAITTIFLGWILVLAQRYDAEQARKTDLKFQVSSPSNEFAVEAVRLLGLHGWLEDGTLNGIIIRRANLQGADLDRADLEGAIFSNTNLNGSFLADSNLRGALILKTDVQNADLENADLAGAILMGANLQGANLEGANVEIADISTFRNLDSSTPNERIMQDIERFFQSGIYRYSATDFVQEVEETAMRYTTAAADPGRAENAQTSLSLAILQLVTNVILPDGTNWTLDVDMARFTDPNHPNFWRSADPQSPAYRAGEY